MFNTMCSCICMFVSPQASIYIITQLRVLCCVVLQCVAFRYLEEQINFPDKMQVGQ